MEGVGGEGKGAGKLRVQRERCRRRGVSQGEKRGPCRQVPRGPWVARSKLSQARQAVRVARLLKVAAKCARHVGQGDGLEINNDDPVWNSGCNDGRSRSVIGAVEHGKARD